MKTITTIIALGLVACGQPLTTTEEQKAKDAQAKAAAASQLTNDATQIQGYISNVFGISVDGKEYSDSEDFYTQKLDELTEAANKSGYEGWSLNFDAELGLNDLKNGMTVYVGSRSSKGFAGSTDVDYDGSFDITIPENARSYTYSLRANKKVEVTLRPGENIRYADGTEVKPVKWCYNFSANVDGIAVNGQPVMLASFTSTLTKYACNVTSGGILIPAKN